MFNGYLCYCPSTYGTSKGVWSDGNCNRFCYDKGTERCGSTNNLNSVVYELGEYECEIPGRDPSSTLEGVYSLGVGYGPVEGTALEGWGYLDPGGSMDPWFPPWIRQWPWTEGMVLEWAMVLESTAIPLSREQTHACKNIPFPQLGWRAVMN